MNFKIIYTGSDKNSGDGDTFRDAIDKVNYNFRLLSKEMDIELQHVFWETIEDTKEAFNTINKNYERIKKAND
jgi:hypothetical protein